MWCEAGGLLFLEERKMCSFNLKRPSLVCLIFSLAVIIVCSANVPAAPPGWSITQLTDNDFDDYNIKISGSNVVWTEWDSINHVSLLFFYNGSTATLLSDKAGEAYFKISGSNVAWAEWDDFLYERPLFFYNNSAITKLSDDIVEDAFKISDSNAAWIAYGALFFYNGSTTTKLANIEYEESFKISGSNVGWTEWDDVNYVTSLFFYNGSTATKLSDNAGGESFKISGSNVVWIEWDDVNYISSLFFYNGSTITKLATSTYIDEDSFEISDSNVGWAEWDDVNEVTLLCFYNGSAITKLSDNFSDDIFKISGSNICWTEWNDVYSVTSLFFYNGSTITKLAANIDTESINISGSNVVFTRYDSMHDNWPFYFFNGTTTTKVATDIDTYSIKISGSNVIWTEWDDANYVSLLFLYDGSTVSKLADIPEYASYDISGSNIVWQEYVGDDTDLFFATQIIGLQVTLGPAEAVLEGAQWNVDGGDWQDSGAIITDLSAGLHTVNYKPIAGWEAPESESVTINEGSGISFSRDYISQPSGIEVTLGPAEAVSEGAQWNIDGGDWQDSGAIVTGLSPGLHTVNYKSIFGWFTPSSESVTINRGTTPSVSRSYTPRLGSIQISLWPIDAFLDGAQWNIDGGDWQESGAEVTDLPAGSYTVNYKTITGWNAPASESVTVNRVTRTYLDRDYAELPGNLQVTLGPAGAVSEGAQWKVDGGEWQNSGAVITGLSAGLHTLSYKSLTGWHTPGSESVAINKGTTTSISRNYIEFPGGINITLGPSEAVTAGAQWNIDGGSWQNSGAIVTGLSPGVHTVNYKPVAGWIARPTELITVNRSMTNSISRSYISQDRGLVIKKCNITACSGINDNSDIINFSGIIGITSAELRGSYQITVKIGDVYSEEILISSFIVKNGKFTYTYRIPGGGKGRITSLVIDTNKHTFSLKTRKVDLSGLHCPFDIEFDTGNYWGISSIYENTANGRGFIPVKLMSGVEDYLQIKWVKVRKGRLSDTLKVKGGIAYQVLPMDINDVVLKLGSQTFTLPAKNFKPSGKSGYKYVCTDIKIPGGIASATFDFGKGTFNISIKNTEINPSTGKVSLTLTIGGFEEQVDFDLDTGQAI
jgi:hypothetical protein